MVKRNPPVSKDWRIAPFKLHTSGYPMTDLEKTLRRLKVTVKVTELPISFRRGQGFNLYRVSFQRPGPNKKPLRFTFPLISYDAPTLEYTFRCLVKDAVHSGMTPWDFAQTTGESHVTEAIERKLAVCKTTARRAERFFGASCAKVFEMAADLDDLTP